MTIKKNTPAKLNRSAAATLRADLQDVQRLREKANDATQRVASLQQKLEAAESAMADAINTAHKAEAVLLAGMKREGLRNFKVGRVYACAMGDRLELLTDETPDLSK